MNVRHKVSEAKSSAHKQETQTQPRDTGSCTLPKVTQDVKGLVRSPSKSAMGQKNTDLSGYSKMISIPKDEISAPPLQLQSPAISAASLLFDADENEQY